MTIRIWTLAAAAACLAPAVAGAQTAGTARLASTASIATAPPVLDTAIAQLQSFLQRYPTSTLRPAALYQLGELLVRRADERFAAAQRAAGQDSAAQSGAPIKPDYGEAIGRYEELIANYPQFDKLDAAEYTLGTLYGQEQRFADAARMFERVAAVDSSKFRPEALFRLGDARFELASRARGEPRRALFAQSANAYEQATSVAQPPSDIYFLSLYKLGWAYYNQANQADQTDYRKAVNVFGQLVDAYDKLTPEQQARLGLRGEAIEYMAVAFTQVGGADAANRYFAQHGGSPYRAQIIQRVAQSLRDQGDFTGAVRAYQQFMTESPTDSTLLGAQEEIVDIYQNRMLEPDSAQAARLKLVSMFAPNGAWAQANASLRDSASKARETALRQSAQYLLASAQAGQKNRYGEAAQLYQQYLSEYPNADSAQAYNTYYAEALFGQGDYVNAGKQYMRAAYEYQSHDSTLAQEAGRNAIVALDSALAHDKTAQPTQDAFFQSVDRYVAAFPNSDVSKKALIEKGRRASETQRWDVMASTFQTYAQRYPNDPYTPTAQKLIGDAEYRSGQYAEAQRQWTSAQQVAMSTGRRALADSIAATRTTAAASYADTLVKQGQYAKAAEDVYVAYAQNNPNNAKAPDALRNAIETYMLADSAARAKGDQSASNQARERAIVLSEQLTRQYPNYKYATQYAALRAQLLADLGHRDESVQAYQQLIATNVNWSGRPDAMIRVATALDSAGQKKEAAQAYAQFAQAYPRDQRASGAAYNAAVTYEEAGDSVAAAKAFADFARRFPNDQRAAEARSQQVRLLAASGDSSAANAALASACANPTEDVRSLCAGRAAGRQFAQALATFQQYQPIALEIRSRSQLTQAGVARASARKQALLKQVATELAQSIKSGVPAYVAAGSYYAGLAQYEYGEFLKNVQLPGDLTDAQKTAAQQGAAQQAEQYYQLARQTWQELLDKAQNTPELTKDPKAAAWVQKARDAVQGNVDKNPGGVSQ